MLPANLKGNNKNKKDIRNEVAVASLPILRGQPLFQELSRSMVDLLVHEEHACSFFLYALPDEPFSDHMSTNLCLPHEATAASAAHPVSILAMTEGTAT